MTIKVLTADAVQRLADGQRDPAWHSDFPQETDVALARLAVEQRAWSDPVTLLITTGGVVVGTVALTPRGAADDGWSVGYHVIGPVRRQGIATAALGAVTGRWRPLTAESDPANTASARVLTHAGFLLQESGDPAVLQWKLSD